MDYLFPIFILAKDDKSIRISKTQNDISYYEQSDIEEGLYEGWDSRGYPLRITWDMKEGAKIEVTDINPHIDKLKEVFYNYAKLYRPDAPFIYNGQEDDMVKLFQAVEEHINADRLLNKIKKFFTRKH